jgi:GT2 family glycosyltransferase
MIVKIQAVLFENQRPPLQRFLSAVVESIRNVEHRVVLHIGDCSARPLLDPDELSRWCQTLARGRSFETRYTSFGTNLGFGQGHNQLWRESSDADRLLVINPDTLPAFHLLRRLSATADTHANFGAVEPRQVPIEHPKSFDVRTGETDWVSGACFLVSGDAFTTVGGFDDLFFMYGEDVDLSWRLRSIGKQLYVCPETFVLHAKRVVNGSPVASTVEQHHGPLSLMLLRAKYGHEALNAPMLALLRRDANPENVRMLDEYERQRQHLTPAPAQQVQIARFAADGGLVDQRWTYPLPNRLAQVP